MKAEDDTLLAIMLRLMELTSLSNLKLPSDLTEPGRDDKPAASIFYWTCRYNEGASR